MSVQDGLVCSGIGQRGDGDGQATGNRQQSTENEDRNGERVLDGVVYSGFGLLGNANGSVLGVVRLCARDSASAEQLSTGLLVGVFGDPSLTTIVLEVCQRA